MIARRVVRATLIGALLVAGLYLIPANLVLNTPLGSRLFNRRPERFHIRWRLAFSPWPGFVHLRGVETGGRSRVVDWQARLGSVDASFDVLPLFRREVRLGRVRGRGVEYLQRPRPAPGDPIDPGAADWPPEASFTTPPEAPDGAPRPPRPDRPPWTIRADRILCDIDQVWIGRYRITGPARVVARMDLVTRGPLEFPRIEYRLDSGELWTGTEKMFEDFRLFADLRIDSFSPRGRQPGDLVRRLSGEADVDVRGASIGLLDFYFRRIPQVKFGRRGPARIHLKIASGLLLPGTRLELDGQHLEAVFLDQQFTGSGHVVGVVVEEGGVTQSRLEAVLDEFRITRAGQAEPFARGRDFRVVATSTSLDLADPFEDMRLSIDLSEAHIPDLRHYNLYIPPQTRFAIVSGVGRMSYHFEAEPRTRTLQGRMDLLMQDVAARFEDVVLKGNVRILAPLRESRPRDLRFDISGTRILIHSADPPWNGAIHLPVSKMRFSEPMQVQARARLELQDTRPLVAAFDAYRDMPRILERLMTIRDVRGTADIDVGRDAVVVQDLEAEGRGFLGLGDLTFGKAGRDGILYFRLHGFSLGIDLRSGTKDLRFMRPRAWFDKARAERRSGGPRPEPAPVK